MQVHILCCGMTEINDMRSHCPIANGLEILGDRWTLLIVRDLMFTNRREFGHFLQAGEGISTNILTERLNRLQYYGIISKFPHPYHGKKFQYELSDEGLKLAPTLIEFSLWSAGTIENTFIPPELIGMMQNQRKKLLSLIKKRHVFIELDL